MNRNNGKQVNLSTQYRLSGLPSGARLELIQLSKSPSVVTVALQLPESEASGVQNGRMVGKFPSTTTLWQVLRRFEAGVADGSNTKRNFTARHVSRTGGETSASGRLYYEAPVLHIEGKDHSTLKDYERSLGSLGYNSGNVLLRLRFEPRDQPWEEAVEEISTFFKPDETEATMTQTQTEAPQDPIPAILPPSVPGAQGDTPMEDAPPEVAGLSLQSAPEGVDSVDASSAAVDPVSTPQAPLLDISNRPITVLAPPSSTTPQAAKLPHNSSDFVPTVAHAKTHQARLAENSRNKRLLSDAEIQAQEEAQAEKFAQIREVEIKVRFPDQSSVIQKFGREDTAQTLYAQVRKWLAWESEPFSLNVAGGRGTTALPRGQQKLVDDLKLSGKLLVIVVWEDGASMAARSGKSLKPEFANNAQPIPVSNPTSNWVEDTSQVSTSGKEDTPKKEKKGAGLKNFLAKLHK